MNSVWLSLAWKEWHEHKWKLGAIVAILWGVAAPVLAYAEAQDTLALSISLVVVCTAPLAVFVGLGAAASERSRNTLPFLQSLPVPMWWVAVTKLVLGLITLIVPIALTVAFIYGWTWVARLFDVDFKSAIRQVETGSITGMWYLDCMIICSPIAASLFIWAAAVGVNRKDEIRAGAVALSAMVGWCLVILFGIYLLSRIRNQVGGAGTLEVVGVSTTPAGFIIAVQAPEFREVPAALALIISTAAITHLLLSAWYIRRFGRISNLEIHSPKIAVRESALPDWLPSPRASVFTAVAWKQFRESAPLVLTGLAGVIGIVALFLVIDPTGFISRPDQLAELFSGVAVSLGFGVALIVGIGVCLNDVAPAVNTFWRSRPINADIWFWTKFATGILILIGALYVPILIVVLAMHPDPHGLLLRPESMIMPAAHIAIFAAAVAMTCLVRHAVYAAILSISVVYLGTLFGLGIAYVADFIRTGHATGQSWWNPTELQVAFGMMISFVISTLLAWLTTRYDWGRQSRY